MLPATQSNEGSTGRPLRILIVDDNHINLSVLSTLLKRRFSHLIDGSPVTVDSGLKAIQLLRTHIFDCILMDIQMPFLSGVEATRRIRNAKDGILPANSDAHIIAVTTAIGDEPEVTYRKAGMDGMIGKPVRFQNLQQYLCPLAYEATISSQSVTPLMIDGESVLPPLPPVSQHERVFYLPAEGDIPSSRPDICKGSDFEVLLEAQTRMSLRLSGAMAIARTGSITGASQRPMSRSRQTEEETLAEEGSLIETATSSSSSRSNSSSSLEKMEQCKTSISPGTKLHSRSASMTISRRILNKQIAREVTNAGLDCDSSESPDSASESDSGPFTLPSVPHRLSNRPSFMHRCSSPGWLLSEDVNIHADKVKEFYQSNVPARPKLSISDHLNAKQTSSSSSGSGSSGNASDLFSPPLRRESQTSSTSTISEASSRVTTPECDEGWSPFGPTQSAFEFDKKQNRKHSCSSNSTIEQALNDFAFQANKEVWNVSSETKTATSSPFTVRSTTSTKGNETSSDSVDHLDSSPIKYRTLTRRRGLVHSQQAMDLAKSIRQLDLSSC